MSEPEPPPVLAPATPRDGRRGLAGGRGRPLAERELTALWLLGRVPEDALPWPLLRPGRAGRGPGPDVREACFLTAGGMPRAGDVEMHLRASDFARHGHHRDPAYDGVLLHLVWEDDQREPVRLASGRHPPTVAAGPALGGDPRRLRAPAAAGPAPRDAVRAGGAQAAARRDRRAGARRGAEAAGGEGLARRPAGGGSGLERRLGAAAGRRAPLQPAPAGRREPGRAGERERGRPRRGR